MVTIGFWLTSLNSHVQRELYARVEKIAAERDVRVICYVGSSLDDGPINTLRNKSYYLTHESVVQGLIVWSSILGTYVAKETCTQFIKDATAVPTVSLGMEIPGLLNIIQNDYQGAYDSVCHLVRTHGLTRIACFRGPLRKQSATQRYQGYVDALRDCGIPFRDDYVFEHIKTDQRIISDTVEQMGERLAEIEAFVIFNDSTAKNLMIALKEQGLTIPNDKAVIGFDNVPDSQYYDPPLTTVAVPVDEMAREVVDCLLAAIEGKPHISSGLPASRLIVRNSCGCGLHDKIETNVEIFGKKPLSRDQSFENLFIKARQLNIFSLISETELRRLLHSFSETIRSALYENVKSTEPIQAFRRILFQVTNATHKSLDWQKCISLLRIFMLGNEINDELKETAENFFHLVREHAAEYIDKVHFEHNFIAKSKNEILSNLSSDLISKPSLIGILTSIGTICPVLKINQLCISFFEKHSSKNSRAQLMFSYNIDSTTEATGSSIESLGFFPAHLLIPEKYQKTFAKKNFLVMPLTSDHDFYGFFLIIIDELHAHPDVLFRFQQLISTHLWDAITLEERVHMKEELAVAHEQAQNSVKASEHFYNMSIKDELTGLYNRRGFFIKINDMRSDPVQTENLALFFLDMDGLKAINDTYGHEEGDCAIRACADILLLSFRKSDIISRLGGDEFVVIARGVNHQISEEVSARLKEATIQVNVNLEKPYQVSFSSGFSFLNRDDPRTIEEIMQAADAQLYLEKKAKKQSRSYDASVSNV